MTIKWGILGTGTIARTYARALQLSANNELVAVGSRSAESANTFAGEFVGDIESYGSYLELLQDRDVDAVYVATPHPEHAAWTIRALQAGKHVLCEKPIGLNHAEAMAMVNAARRNQRFLMEAFMYLLHPQTVKAKQLIEDGAIGKARQINAQFGYHARFNPASRLFANDLGGGGILDVGCYPVSFARFMTGMEPNQISGHGFIGQTGVDEWATALLSFDDGCTAQLATAVSLQLDNTATIYGSSGHIHLPQPWLPDRGDGRWAFTLHRDGEDELIEGSADPLYVLEADHVAAHIDASMLESRQWRWGDTLNNALALDRWREAIGLTYEKETPANHSGPILGDLNRKPRIPAAAVRHLDKPVSRLVMGCDNQPSMAHASVMWDDFFEAGGNCFDTAYIYGQGRMEMLLGHWHTRRNIREELVIVGKGAHTPDNFPAAIAPQLETSLERLQTDYVDVYFLHRDNLDVPVGEFVEALNDEVQRGRIRAFGGSNWTLPRVQAANEYAERHDLQGFSAISNQFSLARMVEQIWPGTEDATSSDFVAYLRDTQTALMPWSSQARGFFTPWADQVIADNGRENVVVTTMQPTVAELQRVWFSDDNFIRRERARELAAARGVPMINIALAYVLHQPFPTFPLIGPRVLEETESCIDSLGIDLSAQELEYLNLADQR